MLTQLSQEPVQRGLEWEAWAEGGSRIQSARMNPPVQDNSDHGWHVPFTSTCIADPAQGKAGSSVKLHKRLKFLNSKATVTQNKINQKDFPASILHLSRLYTHSSSFGMCTPELGCSFLGTELAKHE